MFIIPDLGPSSPTAVQTSSYPATTCSSTKGALSQAIPGSALHWQYNFFCWQRMSDTHHAIDKSIDLKAPLVEERFLTLHPTLRRAPWETDLRFRLRISKSQIASPAEAKVMRGAVKDADRALERLKEECRALQDYIDECQYIAAPIRRLPPEILGKIMMVSYPIDNVFKPNGSDAVRLGSVCKLWRDVSLSLPSVWSSFNLVWVTPGKFSAIAREKIANSLALLLTRSRLAPLSISITFDAMPDEIFEGFLQQLIYHSDRWHTLQITR
ncbi:hypothetical protein Hypma_007284 [Hypsizygus marmoreus]|uniref:Uncharacterized protein n=1 Tax=Hypsizygus marmoreus TaxID=39966 RepID=A0A369KBQ0_HYPMA|nr:hypothetical protein Hypma_007284 [Hypsizygus marmoreus]